MVRYSKKPGNKRAIRKQHSKKGKRSGKSPRRSRLVKPVKKRRKTKLRGGGKKITYIFETFETEDEGEKTHCVEVICEDPSVIGKIDIPKEIKIQENNENKPLNVVEPGKLPTTLTQLLSTYATAQVIIDRAYLKSSEKSDDLGFKKYKFLLPYYKLPGSVSGGGDFVGVDAKKLETLENFKALCQNYLSSINSIINKELDEAQERGESPPQHKKRGFKLFQKQLLKKRPTEEELAVAVIEEVKLAEKEALRNEATEYFTQIQALSSQFESEFNISEVNKLLPPDEQLSKRALPETIITPENYQDFIPSYENTIQGIDALIHDIYQKAYSEPPQPAQPQPLKTQLSTEHEDFYNEKVKNPDEHQHFLNQSGPVDPAEELAFYTELFPELDTNVLQEKIKKYSAVQSPLGTVSNSAPQTDDQTYQNASELIASAFDHSREVSKRQLVGHTGIRVPVPRPPVPRPRPAASGSRPRPPVPRPRPSRLIALEVDVDA